MYNDEPSALTALTKDDLEHLTEAVKAKWRFPASLVETKLEQRLFDVEGEVRFFACSGYHPPEYIKWLIEILFVVGGGPVNIEYPTYNPEGDPKDWKGWRDDLKASFDKEGEGYTDSVVACFDMTPYQVWLIKEQVEAATFDAVRDNLLQMATSQHSGQSVSVAAQKALEEICLKRITP